MTNKYTTSQLCSIFSISPQTVRNWSQDFSRHLSSSAAPGKGRNRMFNEDDLRVFSLIAAMKSNSATHEEIQSSLTAGQRGDLPNLSPSDVQSMVMTDHARAITNLKNEIAALQDERNSTLADLQKARDEALQLRATLEANEANSAKRVAEIMDQLKSAQDRIEKLNREIGRLESKIND